MEQKRRASFRDFFTSPLVVAMVVLAIFSVAFSLGQKGSLGALAAKGQAKHFTIVVIPDTQVYADKYPHIFEEQTAWIAANKSARNIVFVSHLGDIVNVVDSKEQWQIADKAMAKLDGVVPYGIAPGNHDMEPGGASPLYQQYFPLSRLLQSRSLTGTFLDHENSASFNNDRNNYYLFAAGKTDYLALNIEFCPSEPVLEWVNAVLRSYPNRKAIVTSHSVLNSKADRQDGSECDKYSSEGKNAGAEIWQELIVRQKHSNIMMFLGGHDIGTEHGAARRTDIVNGHPIHQILSNYQHLGQGGDGYLRLMTFLPNENKINVTTYSPHLNNFRTDSENQFELNF